MTQWNSTENALLMTNLKNSMVSRSFKLNINTFIVTFYNTSAINNLQTVFDTNSGKIVFAFEGNSGYGIAIVGTVSGTSISFGSTTDFLN